MPGPNKFSPPCDCCECPQTLCVNVYCTGTTTTIPGATITVKDADDVVVGSCVTGGSSGGFGAEFSGSAGSYLSAADATTLRGDGDFWVAGWFKPKTSLGSTIRGLVSKCATATTNRSWQITHTGSTIDFTVRCGVGDETVGKTSALALNTWAFFFAAYQSDTLNISVNGGTFSQLLPDVPGVNAGTSKITIGASHDPASGSPGYIIGTLDQVAFGKSPSSSLSTIRDLLYNSGNGKTYAALTGTEKINIGILHHWSLEESSGNRADDQGSVTLAQTGTVGQGDGIDRINYVGAGCCFDIVSAVPVTYTVEVTHPDYQSATDEITFSSCSLSKNLTLYLCPTEFSIVLTSTACTSLGNPEIPANYVVSGDFTASGAVTVPGTTTLGPFTLPSTCDPEFSVALTWDSGHGAILTKTFDSSTWSPCEGNFPVTVIADAAPGSAFQGVRGIQCGNVFMPATLEYSDDYGSCTLTYGATLFDIGWVGSYTYSSGEVLPGYPGSPTTVRVNVAVRILESCTGATLTAIRRIGAACDLTVLPRQKRFVPDGFSSGGLSVNQSGSVTPSPCSTTTISHSFTFGAWSWVGTTWSSCSADSDPELATSATITGTTAT
jgi:hypothetical protein